MLGHLARIEGDVGLALVHFSDVVTRAEALLLNERENMDLTNVVCDRAEMLEAALAARRGELKIARQLDQTGRAR